MEMSPFVGLSLRLSLGMWIRGSMYAEHDLDSRVGAFGAGNLPTRQSAPSKPCQVLFKF